MKLQNAAAPVIVFVLGVVGAANAAGTGAAEIIYQKTEPSGSVELSNFVGAEPSEPVVVGEPTSSSPTPELAAGTALASGSLDKADPTQAKAPGPIAWYGSIPPSEIKDAEWANTLSKIGATQLASGNPAAGRRYLMMDRNTYMKLYGAN